MDINELLSCDASMICTPPDPGGSGGEGGGGFGGRGGEGGGGGGVAVNWMLGRCVEPLPPEVMHDCTDTSCCTAHTEVNAVAPVYTTLRRRYDTLGESSERALRGTLACKRIPVRTFRSSLYRARCRRQ
jgi:hypothetical protein